MSEFLCAFIVAGLFRTSRAGAWVFGLDPVTCFFRDQRGSHYHASDPELLESPRNDESPLHARRATIKSRQKNSVAVLDSQGRIWQCLAVEIIASSLMLRANAPESRKLFPIRIK